MIASWLFIFAWISLVGLGARWARKHRAQRKAARRTDKHEAYLAFVTELIDEPEILQAAVDAGSIKPEVVSALRRMVNESSYAGVRALTAKVLENRNVRRLVTRHMAAKHGVNRSDYMRKMGAFLGEVRG